MLSKKEKADLYNQKAIAEKWDGLGAQRYNVHFSLTMGEMIAFNNLMRNASTVTQEDVKAYFKNALARAGIDLSEYE